MTVIHNTEIPDDWTPERRERFAAAGDLATALRRTNRGSPEPATDAEWTERETERAGRFLAAFRLLGVSDAEAEDRELLSDVGFEGLDSADVARRADRFDGDPWGWISEQSSAEDAEALKRAIRKELAADPSGRVAAKPDLSGPAREPDWIIEGEAAAKRATMVSADQSASKTTRALEQSQAVARGEGFLGQRTKRGRVLYVTGEEDLEQITEEKLKPLGFIEADLEQIDFYTRGTFPLLGTEEGNTWIVGAAEAGDFALIVLDTTSSVVTVESNSNDAVNRLFDEVFDPLLDRTGAALL